MAVNYNFGKNRNADPAGVYADIAVFFQHLIAYGVELQAFELKPDGTILVRLRDPLPEDDLRHLGLVP